MGGGVACIVGVNPTKCINNFVYDCGECTKCRSALNVGLFSIDHRKLSICNHGNCWNCIRFTTYFSQDCSTQPLAWEGQGVNCSPPQKKSTFWFDLAKNGIKDYNNSYIFLFLWKIKYNKRPWGITTVGPCFILKRISVLIFKKVSFQLKKKQKQNKNKNKNKTKQKKKHLPVQATLLHTLAIWKVQDKWMLSEWWISKWRLKEIGIDSTRFTFPFYHLISMV